MSDTVKVSTVEEADAGTHVFVTEHLSGSDAAIGEPHPLGQYLLSAAELQQVAQQKIDELFLDPQRVGAALTESDLDAIQTALRECEKSAPHAEATGEKIHTSPFRLRKSESLDRFGHG